MADNDLIRRGDAKAICGTIIRNDEAARIEGFLATLPAAQVTVKPLEWRDDGTNGHETDHAFGFYEVYPSPEGDMLSRDGVDSGVFPTIEAAKAAAQADYDARIRSALTVMPHDPAKVQALVEALEALIQLAHDCEKELTEDLHHMDFCGESEPLTKARAALAAMKEV